MEIKEIIQLLEGIQIFLLAIFILSLIRTLISIFGGNNYSYEIRKIKNNVKDIKDLLEK